MSEFKIIETQEQLNSIIGERLAKKEASVREEMKQKYADYDSLKEQISSFATTEQSYKDKIAELEKANGEHSAVVDGLNKKIKQFETDSLKVKIALESGIPYEMASRLNGVDEESIRKDASIISSFVNTKHTPPKRNPEAKDVPDDAYSKMLKDIIKE